MYFSGGDIDNAFYRFEAPENAKPFFTLPSIRAKLVGVSKVAGCSIDPSVEITPVLNVLPMGWSWSLWCCQKAHEGAGVAVEQCDNDLICDRNPNSPLTQRNFKHAKYVDNFLVASHDPELCAFEANKLESKLGSHGFLVHELLGPRTQATFAGIDFDGVAHTAKISPNRVWKLRLAIDHVLSCRYLSPESLEAIVGHYTWACLLRREGLCVLQHVYEFIRCKGSGPIPLWPSVAQELMWARALLPLLVTHLSLPWQPTVYTSDASDTGYGVCESTWETSQVAFYGRRSERWRYMAEDAIAARSHALGTLISPNVNSSDPQYDYDKEDTFNSDDNFDYHNSVSNVCFRNPDKIDPDDIPFHEIDPSLLAAQKWRTIIKGRWRNI